MPSSRDSGDFRDGRHGRDVRGRDARDHRSSSQTSSSPALKRLKTSTSRETSVSSSQSSRSSQPSKSLTEPKIDFLEISMKALKAEEEEAIGRSTDQNLKEFRLTCNSIRDFCNKILDLKNSNDKDKNKQLESYRIKCSLLFLALKTLNRLDKYRCRDIKDKLQSAKQKVDCHQLQLQNLLYEVMQLQRQSKACLLFRSKDEKINLVPMEDFLKEADEDLKEKAIDEHSTRLARLDWELRQRKQLEDKLKSAEEVKKSLEESISAESDTLDKLPSMLQSVLDSTQPLYSEFNMSKEPGSGAQSDCQVNGTDEPDPECVKASVDAISAEKGQALSRSAEDIFEEFRTKCDSIRSICEKVLKVKNSEAKDRDKKRQIEALRLNGAFELLDMTKLDRFGEYHCDEAQDKLEKAKLKNDSHHSELQTVSYALIQMEKKYKSCLFFKSKDEAITLVPLDQFFAEADEDLKRMAIDDHSTRLARLEWELRQRQHLEEKLKSGEETKKSLEEQIVSNGETLERLQSMLKTVIEETQPLYSELNIPQQSGETSDS